MRAHRGQSKQAGGLWRHVKQDVLANEPTPDLDASVGYARQHIFGLTPQQRLRKAGMLSYTFWLHKVLHEHVKLLLSKYLSSGRRLALDKVDKIVT